MRFIQYIKPMSEMYRAHTLIKRVGYLYIYRKIRKISEIRICLAIGRQAIEVLVHVFDVFNGDTRVVIYIVDSEISIDRKLI